MVDRDTFAQFEREAARVFDYCRALTGRDDVAARLAEAALSSARSMAADPDLLGAWLVALARRQALATEGGAADSREVFELVYRHGIRREDLGAVLGVPVDEAVAALAAAELEFARPVTPAEPDPAEEAPSRLEVASGQSLLRDQDQLRAWLFALARQQALARTRRTVADFEAPGPEPMAGGPAGRRERQTGRRKQLAALTAIPLAALIGVAGYLGSVSHPVGSRAARTERSASGPVRPPRPVWPSAGPAAAAPHPSPSPAVPISILFPAVPPPLVEPSTSPRPTAPSPTPKASAKPSPTVKSSPSPTPKPTPTPTPKSSATPTPKPSSPTPKPSPG